MSSLIVRAGNKARRVLASRFACRIVPLRLERPIVSFTFDDAPASTFGLGSDILEEFGARATYYVSLGLLDSETEVGRIASLAELERALAKGHELGCHTYDHLDAWHVSTDEYMASVARNESCRADRLPAARFSTFAYPKSGATRAVKSRLQQCFAACRGGGQLTNEHEADLYLLKACFLDRRTGVDEEFIERLIDYNAAKRGWLILATHDITGDPSPYGCTPRLLEAAARRASRSGADLLPVEDARLKVVRAAAEPAER